MKNVKIVVIPQREHRNQTSRWPKMGPKWYRGGKRANRSKTWNGKKKCGNWNESKNAQECFKYCFPDKKNVYDALTTIMKNCTFNNVSVDKMPIFDFEYVFLKIHGFGQKCRVKNKIYPQGFCLLLEG